MNKKSLEGYYVFLAVLTLTIILLIILFINLNYNKFNELKGFPSLGLWKPAGVDFGGGLNLSENDSAIEKVRKTETPFNTKVMGLVAERFWLSFIILFLIVLLLIAWVLIVFRIHNG